MSNRTIFTQEKKEAFLEFLSSTGNITQAAQHAGVSRRTVYDHKAADPDFEKAWDAAEQLGLDAMEDEVTRRGVEGWDEPVWYQGEQCGVVRKFSDTLLMYRLNGGRPEKYRQRVSTELTGKNGGPIQTRNVDDLTDEQLIAIAIGGRPTPPEPEKGKG